MEFIKFIMINKTDLYIDPSVMTYAIQIIAGIVVAVGAVVGVRIRKAKKKVQEKLGIDENSKKEVEEDISVDTDSEHNDEMKK